jgi:hypothetical protein
MEGRVDFIDGVKVVIAPDGTAYRYADIQRYNNPGAQVDDRTGELMASMPSADVAPTPPDDRSLGERVGNEDIAAGVRMMTDADASLYNLLDPSGRYSNTLLGRVNRAALSPLDMLLGGLTAGSGVAQKGMGYASDALGLDLRPGDIPTAEEQGQLADALYALPTSRMLGAVSEAGGRAAAAQGALDLADPVVDPMQQAVRRRSLPDYAYMTNEAQPYAAVGRDVLEGDIGVDSSPFLPGATSMTQAERAAFAAEPRRSWIDPETGGDILSQEVGARTLPTLRGQGMYDGPDGVEFNPLSIGRSYATPEQLQATESLRGLLDVQGGTPWTRLAAGDMPAVFLPKTRAGTPEEMVRLKEAGAPFGLSDIVDVGEGYILTNYMGGPTNVNREASRALERASGLKAIRSTAESGYPGYEGAWERGAGQAIRRYMENIQGADEAAVSALEASPAVQQAARDRAMLAREAGATLGGSNNVVEEMLRTVGRGEGFGDRLQSYAERLEARRIEPQIPLFNAGVQPSGQATHFSSVENLPALDPSKQFTNPSMRGAERALPAPYPPQTYFGVNVDSPGGYTKESALGDVRYDIPEMPTNLLDLASGWGDISDEADAIVSRMEATSGQAMTPAARDAALQSYRMRIAKLRGYGGLYNPTYASGPVVTSFYPVATGAQ